MMSCLGGSRSYTIPHIRPPSTPKLLPLSESKTIVASSSAPAISETKNSNICLPKPVKKRRTRRGRPRDSYTRAIAAFYTIYPRIFPEEGDVCPLVKIEPRSPAEKTELLQELPALLSKLREAEEELPLILSNFNRVDSPSPSPSPSPSLSKLASGSPEFDEESEEGGLREESCEVESFLEATDIEGGMDTILGRPMVGASASASATAIQLPEQRHPDVVDPTAYVSAIRGRRRCLDGVADGGVWNGQMRRLRFKDKLKAEKEMNAMSFCSLDWLKRDEPPRKLSLQLDYEQVRNAWSGRGSLFIEDGHCPNTDDEDDYDSASYALENVDIGLVPDVSFWRGHVEECSNVNANISYPIEDGCRTVEEDVERKTGIREARVLRYKEKRQTRLFSKKIRYEVRKLNAEKRPRMKGRFVKRELD